MKDAAPVAELHSTIDPDAAVQTIGVGKSYGPVRALKSVDVTIKKGEYFVLLGPSGGGKTTLLRLIGGFIRPTAGHVLLGGKDVSDLPPEQRSTSMVFQSYALFPHMTVAQNVGYGLRLQKRPKAEIASEVDAMLDLVGLAGYGDRRPFELSGGQQQRVQLARALILKSDILLLDEPLAALDAQLRKDMCFELKHLQEKVGITFIHVTHNQEEAMTVADRVALVADGELVEVAGVRDIYEAPKRRFTAEFVGERNILEGTVNAVGGADAQVDIGGQLVTVPLSEPVAAGDAVSVSVRSESLSLVDPAAELAEGVTRFLGTYVESVYLGLVTRHVVRLESGGDISVREVQGGPDAQAFAPGTPVAVTWRSADAILHSN
jgi:ABC-type Fe3+/spermidine/putrescine transport system ATPase subunit